MEYNLRALRSFAEVISFASDCRFFWILLWPASCYSLHAHLRHLLRGSNKETYNCCCSCLFWHLSGFLIAQRVLSSMASPLQGAAGLRISHAQVFSIGMCSNIICCCLYVGQVFFNMILRKQQADCFCLSSAAYDVSSRGPTYVTFTCASVWRPSRYWCDVPEMGDSDMSDYLFSYAYDSARAVHLSVVCFQFFGSVEPFILYRGSVGSAYDLPALRFKINEYITW